MVEDASALRAGGQTQLGKAYPAGVDLGISVIVEYI